MCNYSNKHKTDSLSLVGGKLLRRGYTTGTCAAAAAKASCIMLFEKKLCDSVRIKTPEGTILKLDTVNAEYTVDYAVSAVQKDSGDDPDITNGVLVYAKVECTPFGIEIKGGKGIGVVTKPGLDRPPGDYAINSTPRQMIITECEAVCNEYGYKGGLLITISIPAGEKLALKTFNPRLGIMGGLSILGTTGIVEPMSENSIADTIRAELSLLYETGHHDILFTIGNYGEAFAGNVLGLTLESHVKCSNFIGEALKAAAEKGFLRALLIGHIGKLVKLGIGITNTHSNHGDGRREALIACALEAGGSLGLLYKISECISTDAALECISKEGLFEKTMAILKERIADTIERHVAANLEVGFVCFCGSGNNLSFCFQSDDAKKFLEVFAL